MIFCTTHRWVFSPVISRETSSCIRRDHVQRPIARFYSEKIEMGGFLQICILISQKTPWEKDRMIASPEGMEDPRPSESVKQGIHGFTETAAKSTGSTHVYTRSSPFILQLLAQYFIGLLTVRMSWSLTSVPALGTLFLLSSCSFKLHYDNFCFISYAIFSKRINYEL